MSACSDDATTSPGTSGGSGGQAGSAGAAGTTAAAGTGTGGQANPSGGNAGHGGAVNGGSSAGQASGGQAGGAGNSAGTGGAALGGAGGSGGGGGSGGASAGSGGTASGGGGAGGGSGYSPCPATGACKIMPFGDSITQGFNVSGGYRAPLFKRAHADGHDITFVGSANDYAVSTVDGVPFPPNHEGHGGWTIDDNASRNMKGISSLVGSSMKNYKPHIVTLMIGTNDINGNNDVGNAPKRLGALLDAIHAENADTLIVLAQIVPTRTDSTNQAVSTFNAAMPALVSERTAKGWHIILVDMYKAFTSRSDYRQSLMADNLHPNQAGYDLLGETWYAAIAPLL